MKFKLCIILAILLMLSVGCTRISYSVPTSREIEEFIVKNELNVINSCVIGGSGYAILYEKEKEIGYYLLYKTSNSSLVHQNVFTLKDSSSPVYISGSATGTPFVTVLIADTKILDSAETVEVTFNDGLTIAKSLNKSSGVIIPYGKKDTNIKYKEVIILGKDNDILYRSKE